MKDRKRGGREAGMVRRGDRKKHREENGNEGSIDSDQMEQHKEKSMRKERERERH